MSSNKKRERGQADQVASTGTRPKRARVKEPEEPAVDVDGGVLASTPQVSIEQSRSALANGATAKFTSTSSKRAPVELDPTASSASIVATSAKLKVMTKVDDSTWFAAGEVDSNSTYIDLVKHLGTVIGLPWKLPNCYVLNLTKDRYESDTDGVMLRGGFTLAHLAQGKIRPDGFVYVHVRSETRPMLPTSPGPHFRSASPMAPRPVLDPQRYKDMPKPVIPEDAREAVMFHFVDRYRECFEILAVFAADKANSGKPQVPVLPAFPGTGKSRLSVSVPDIFHRPPEDSEERKRIVEALKPSSFFDEMKDAILCAQADVTQNFMTSLFKHCNSEHLEEFSKLTRFADTKPLYVTFSNRAVGTPLEKHIVRCILKQLGEASTEHWSVDRLWEELSRITSAGDSGCSAIVVFDEVMSVKQEEYRDFRNTIVAGMEYGIRFILVGAAVEASLSKLNDATQLCYHLVHIQPLCAHYISELIESDIYNDAAFAKEVGRKLHERTGGHARLVMMVLRQINRWRAYTLKDVARLLEKEKQNHVDYTTTIIDRHFETCGVTQEKVLPLFACCVILGMPMDVNLTVSNTYRTLKHVLVGFPIPYEYTDQTHIKFVPGTWQLCAMQNLATCDKAALKETHTILHELNRSRGTDKGVPFERLSVATLRLRLLLLAWAGQISCPLSAVLPFTKAIGGHVSSSIVQPLDTIIEEYTNIASPGVVSSYEAHKIIRGEAAASGPDYVWTLSSPRKLLFQVKHNPDTTLSWKSVNEEITKAQKSLKAEDQANALYFVVCWLSGPVNTQLFDCGRMAEADIAVLKPGDYPLESTHKIATVSSKTRTFTCDTVQPLSPPQVPATECIKVREIVGQGYGTLKHPQQFMRVAVETCFINVASPTTILRQLFSFDRHDILSKAGTTTSIAQALPSAG